jgi:class 3 adenylate cyclase
MGTIMQQPRLRYVKSADGVQIAYTTFGEGFPIVSAANAWGDTELFGAGLIGPPPEFWTGNGISAVVYDGRNAGASDRGVEDVSLDARVRDMEAVVDALELERFGLIGIVHGASVAVAYAARHPDRVLRMALMSAYARGDEYYASTPMLRAIKALTEIAEENWEFFTLTLANWVTNFGNAEVARRIASIYSRTMTPGDYRRLIAACEKTDITDLLPQVRASTLVIRSTSLQFSLQPEYTRAVTSAIPGAQLLTVDELPTATVAMRDFFLEAIPSPPPGDKAIPDPSAFRTVLFTDLVGHTDMMTRLGDAKGREVLREHERITRETLAAHGGAEVKTMGDGFMASFGSVTKAVECAVALQRAIDERNTGVGATGRPPLHIRIGLNAGEPIEEDGDLFGATVILASRIAAKAEGGEILVSDNVRSLCAGKGFLFADRGEFTAKGFEEPVRIYEVHWREE